MSADSSSFHVIISQRTRSSASYITTIQEFKVCDMPRPHVELWGLSVWKFIFPVCCGDRSSQVTKSTLLSHHCPSKERLQVPRSLLSRLQIPSWRMSAPKVFRCYQVSPVGDESSPDLGAPGWMERHSTCRMDWVSLGGHLLSVVHSLLNSKLSPF